MIGKPRVKGMVIVGGGWLFMSFVLAMTTMIMQTDGVLQVWTCASLPVLTAIEGWMLRGALPR